MRGSIFSLILCSGTSLFAQFFFGTGADYCLSSADRLDPSLRFYTEYGYRINRMSASALVRIPGEAPEWTSPNWKYGARLSWNALELATDSLALPFLARADWNLSLSTQWNRSSAHRFRSEHLGDFTSSGWTRKVYQFQHQPNTFWAGLGLEGRFGSWSALAEVQWAPWSNLDTWVYQSNLQSDGQEVVLEDYYYYERYQQLRASITLRKSFGF